MGGCLCAPITKVKEDTDDVDMCTKVGGTALFHRHGRRVTGLAGLLYVKDDQVCHKAGIGRKLCCQCCKQTWDLSKDKKMEMATRNRLKIPYSNRRIYLNTGLVITLQRDNDHTRYQMTAMKYNFCMQLTQHMSGHSAKGKSLKLIDHYQYPV